MDALATKEQIRKWRHYLEILLKELPPINEVIAELNSNDINYLGLNDLEIYLKFVRSKLPLL